MDGVHSLTFLLCKTQTRDTKALISYEQSSFQGRLDKGLPFAGNNENNNQSRGSLYTFSRNEAHCWVAKVYSHPIHAPENLLQHILKHPRRPIFLKVKPSCNIFSDITNRLVAAMDNTQKYTDHDEITEKYTTMTEDEERKQKEFRARKLQHLFENAEKAVEDYKQLLEKRRAEVGNRKYNKESWKLGLTDRKK